MPLSSANPANSISLVCARSRTNAKSVFNALLAFLLLSRTFVAIIVWRLNGYQGFFKDDTFGYLALAKSLMHGSFSLAGRPEIFRTPGYPLLLGPAVASGHPILIGLFENFLLAALSAWLIWQIVGALAPDSNARAWAVLLYCLEPVGFLYSEKLLSDLAFSAVLLLFIHCVLRFLRQPSYGAVALTSLVLGLATYIRPTSLLLGLCLLPFLFVLPRKLAWAERFGRATAFALVFAMSLAPWIVRNYQVAGYPGFSSVGDSILYFYSEAAIRAKLEHKDFMQEQQELGWNNGRYLQTHPEQQNWSQAKIARFQSTEARGVISQHPFLYAGIHLRGCAVVIFDPAATEIMKVFQLYPEQGGLMYRSADEGLLKAIFWLFRHYPIVGLVLLLAGMQLLLYYSLALMGMRRLPGEVAIFFVTLFVYVVLVSGSTTAVARYRMPIMPLICVAAGLAISSWQFRRGKPAEGVGQPAIT
jgi:hypothetical protein